MSVISGDGGRRSRRGYAYQDAVTLLDCLDMHNGLFDEVGFEELDDITCTSNNNTTYRQVKTKEDGARHSISTICSPEIKKYPETSILGRLFSNKPVTQGSRFCLVLNETPTRDLAAFRIERGASRGQISNRYCDDIAKRLKELPLPDGLTIWWYIDRFEVFVESRTIEDVERALLSRLAEPVAKLLGMKPLFSELDDVLIRLSTLVARDARSFRPRRWTASFFAERLQEAVTRVTGRRPDGSVEPLQPLADKLRPASIPPDEAQAQVEAMLGYRRRYRSAVGQEREMLDAISDNVFAVCAHISAQRRSGAIADGPPAYSATINAINNLQFPNLGYISFSEKLAALSDVTARCRNRYSDAS